MIHVVILAAGKGTRMHCTQAKVLHQLVGKSLLQHIIDTVKALHPASIFVVDGYQSREVHAVIHEEAVHFVTQKEYLGTGHALMQAYLELKSFAPPDDQVLVVLGDTPALTVGTLTQVQQASNALTLLNMQLTDPTGFGRVVRDQNHKMVRIVEEKDTSPEEKLIQEVYAGVLCARLWALTETLPLLSNHNAQREYYLTQLVELCFARKISVGSVITKNAMEAMGVNDHIQLAAMERYMQRQRAQALMQEGVHILDPQRFDVRGLLQVNGFAIIDVNCIFEGNVLLDENVVIGANCILKNCSIGKGAIIHPYTMIDGAIIDAGARVGPFARVRPGSHLAENAAVGNFVELKNTFLGVGSKASHLSYLGDAVVGENVNIGAGTITCNYNGSGKHKTTIQKGAFIGSNASLVAPVTIHENATIGAGSTITKDAPPNQLTVGRSKQITISGWKRKEPIE